MNTHDHDSLIERLDSFDPTERLHALEELAARVDSGRITLPPTRPEVNLHFHTFFSFNANGWSPTRVAWEAVQYGLEVAGVVDFDVLDAMHEFLCAGELLGLKTVAGIESRVFIEDYADKTMNSPGEPGVAYFMGVGCYQRPRAGTPAGTTLRDMFATARERTRGMMQRLNPHLAPIALDYQQDVLTLTPGGNATERHLLAAYDHKSQDIFPDPAERAGYWAKALGEDPEALRELVENPPKLHEKIRGRLMKRGGVGYVQPDSGSFPTVDAMIALVRDIGALSAYAYLDGSNDGEADMGALLDLLMARGTQAMNIIPDRNWNFADPQVKQEKAAALQLAVEAARERDLPLVVGTEMNKAGLPFVDDFSSPQLQPFVDDFLFGARVVYGHTLLARLCDLGYNSEAAKNKFGNDRAAQNRFYAEVGALPVPDEALRTQLKEHRGQLDLHEAQDMLEEG